MSRVNVFLPDAPVLRTASLAPDQAQPQTRYYLHPDPQTCPIGSRAKWHFLLLFVLAPLLLSASQFLSGASLFLASASQADSSQIPLAASERSSPAEGFSGGESQGEPLSVDQRTPDASQAAKFDRGESNISAALFTHPTYNLLSELTTGTERSTGVLYGFKAIVSSSTARGPPSSVC